MTRKDFYLGGTKEDKIRIGDDVRRAENKKNAKEAQRLNRAKFVGAKKGLFPSTRSR